MPDKTTVQIRTRMASDSLLVFKNIGTVHVTEDPNLYEQEAIRDVQRVLDFLKHNTNGVFMGALRDLMMNDMLTSVANAVPGLRTFVEVESGRMILCSQEGSILLRGSQVIKPVTLGNTTSNKELVEEPDDENGKPDSERTDKPS